MNKQPLISVILPIFNGQQFLSETVNSVLSQTYTQLELIFIDDGSIDNSQEIIESFKENDPRIISLQQKNSGVASARNNGIRRASGDLICFIDQDDLWVKDKLKDQVNFFNSYPETMFLHGNIINIDSNGNTIDKSLHPWKTDASGQCFERLFYWNAIAIQTVCFRKQCIDTIGYMREDIAGVDDYEYWLRFSRHFPIAHLGNSLALYRFHEGNESRKWLLQDIRRTKALEGILIKFPEIYTELGKKIIKEKLLPMYQEIIIELIRQNKYKEARPFLLKSLGLSPFNILNYLLLLFGIIPSKLLSAIKWYFHKLFFLSRNVKQQ